MSWLVMVFENIYLLLFLSMFLHKQPTRKLFRITFCLVIFLIHFLSSYLSLTMVFRFVLSVSADFILVLFGYRDGLFRKVFFSSALSCLYLLTQYLAILTSSWAGWEYPFGNIVQQTLYLLFLSAVLAFAERFRKVEAVPLQNHIWVLLVLIPISSLLLVWFFFPLSPPFQEQLGLLSSISSFLLLVNLLLFVVYRQASGYATLSIQNESIQKAKAHTESFYSKLLESYDRYHDMLHDYKKNLRFLWHLLETKDYVTAKKHVTELSKDISLHSLRFKTGNNTLNSLLDGIIPTEIHAQVFGSLSEEFSLSSVDFCSLLGNALENAVSACQKYGGEITIRLGSSYHHWVVRIQNPIPNEYRWKKGSGRGILIMEMIMKKLGGEILFEDSEGLFSVFMMIPKCKGDELCASILTK